MKMHVYTEAEMVRVVDILESIQDYLDVYDSDEIYDMLNEVIEIIVYEGQEGDI